MYEIFNYFWQGQPKLRWQHPNHIMSSVFLNKASTSVLEWMSRILNFFRYPIIIENHQFVPFSDISGRPGPWQGLSWADVASKEIMTIPIRLDQFDGTEASTFPETPMSPILGQIGPPLRDPNRAYWYVTHIKPFLKTTSEDTAFEVNWFIAFSVNGWTRKPWIDRCLDRPIHG